MLRGTRPLLPPVLRALPVSVACNEQDAAQTRPVTAALAILAAVLGHAAASRNSEAKCAAGSGGGAPDEEEPNLGTQPSRKKPRVEKRVAPAAAAPSSNQPTLFSMWSPATRADATSSVGQITHSAVPRFAADASTPPASSLPGHVAACAAAHTTTVTAPAVSDESGSSAAQVLEPAPSDEPTCVAYGALLPEELQIIENDYSAESTGDPCFLHTYVHMGHAPPHCCTPHCHVNAPTRQC